MSYRNHFRFAAVFVLFLVAVIAFACSSQSTANKPATNAKPSNQTQSSGTPSETKPPTMTDYPVGNAQSPTEAYKMLFAAVKSQDTAKIREMMSQGSLGLAQMASDQQKKPIEEVLKNGFSETTFADTMPQLRDQRIKGNFGAVEVWNANRKAWEDVPFILEGGVWKAAFGDAFGGKWQSPGKGQAVLEQEAANAKNPNLVQGLKNANVNANLKSVRRSKP